MGDPSIVLDANVPSIYLTCCAKFLPLLYTIMSQENTLSKGDATHILNTCNGNGFVFLRWVNLLFNTKLMQLPMNIIAYHPVQYGKSFAEYCNYVCRILL